MRSQKQQQQQQQKRTMTRAKVCEAFKLVPCMYASASNDATAVARILSELPADKEKQEAALEEAHAHTQSLRNTLKELFKAQDKLWKYAGFSLEGAEYTKGGRHDSPTHDADLAVNHAMYKELPCILEKAENLSLKRVSNEVKVAVARAVAADLDALAATTAPVLVKNFGAYPVASQTAPQRTVPAQ